MWLLSTCPVERLREPARAVELAKQAAQQRPELHDYRAILGAAQYRAGDWQGCVATLQNHLPAPQDPDRGAGFFLAMAYWRLGDQAKACETFEQAAYRQAQLKRPSIELQRFQAEAKTLLGLESRQHSQPSVPVKPFAGDSPAPL